MKGLLTLAGEGSRMLPWTRGLRKELLPLYDRGVNGLPVLKPVANFVLETLVDAGLQDVVLVVGGQDGGASVQSYFTIDREFLARHAHHSKRLADIAQVYRVLETVRLRFAVQPEPRGFGDAVLWAQPFLGTEPFVLHAGDAVLLERHRGHVPSLLGHLLERDGLDAVLFVRKVPNPTNFGVVEGRPAGREGELRRIEVTGMEEKPEHPRSNWAATAVYAFSTRIFDALRTVAEEHPNSELELTAGIQQMLSEGARIAALVLDPRYADWRSVGSPDGYLRVLRRTYEIARTGRAFGVPNDLGATPLRPAIRIPALLESQRLAPLGSSATAPHSLPGDLAFAGVSVRPLPHELPTTSGPIPERNGWETGRRSPPGPTVRNGVRSPRGRRPDRPL
jgi:UTP--glucose-1-phosphate uridylyltransferase